VNLLCQVVLQDRKTKRLTLVEYQAPDGECIDRAEAVAAQQGKAYVTCARISEGD